jgi:hypothetical protein
MSNWVERPVGKTRDEMTTRRKDQVGRPETAAVNLRGCEASNDEAHNLLKPECNPSVTVEYVDYDCVPECNLSTISML